MGELADPAEQDTLAEQDMPGEEMALPDEEPAVVYPFSVVRGRRERTVYVRCPHCDRAHVYSWPADLPHPATHVCLNGGGAMFVRAPLGWRGFEVRS